MKSRILQNLLAFFLVSLPSMAETFRPALLITHVDGSSVKYCLEEQPKLSFQNEILWVAFQGESVAFERSTIAALSYVDDPEVPSAVGQIAADEAPSVVFYDHAFSVTAAQPVALAVYSLSGQRVWSQMSVANAQTRLEYAALTPGVYVLKCGSHAYKFVVR